MKIMTKRLLVAVCLLVVSATLLGSASFAWFSMNTEVNVEGIEVEAYSDSLFLEIKGSGVNAEFGVSAQFATGKKSLRLITNAFLADEEVVKIVVTPATGYYLGEAAGIVYYVKADSDVTGGKDNYVIADLDAPTSTTGLYKLTFVRNSASATFSEGDTTAYYKKDLATNSYVKVDNSSFVIGESLAAYYTTTTTPTVETTGAVYDGSSMYYSLSGNTYTIVGDLELGTKLDDKYFTIEDMAHDAVVGENDPENDPTGDPEDDPAEDPELQNEDEEPAGTMATYYYVKNDNDEYSCLGLSISAALDTYPEFYWGRAYSNTLGQSEGTNTLNVIGESDLPSYVYRDTVSLRCAKNTNTAQNLKIAEVKIGGKTNALSEAIRILFVATNGKGEVRYVTYDNGDAAAFNGALFSTILGDEGEIVTVDMYIYFDGTDEVAKTATVDAGVFNGQTVEVKFTIAEQPYNE